jgi:uncharacterized protein YggE
MKKKIFLIGLVSTLLLAGCNTREASTDQSGQSSISVSGTGTASAAPDVVDIQMGVDTADTDPVAAGNQNSEKMNAIITVLGEMGIADMDIQTINYSMWVEDVYDQDNQPTGAKRYRVTNQLNIRLRDLSQIGTLIEEATNAGATYVSGITFGVADTTELEQAALDEAIANASQKAEWVANEMGVNIGSLITLIEGGFNTPPMPLFAEERGVGGGGEVPISQGQFSVSAQVQVVYKLIP